MKHLLAPATALVLTLTGYSLNAAGWFQQPASARTESRHADSRRDDQRRENDSFNSDAAFRHRTAQPTHWRSMLMCR